MQNEEQENYSPLLYQNIKDKIVYSLDKFGDRMKLLPDLVSFGETLCVLTECKDAEYYGRDEKGLNNDMLSMGEVWEILITAALCFEEALAGVEWDGEWYECVENYYSEVVSPKIFTNAS